MMLVDAYSIDRMEALETLFRLLSERTPNQSISHKQMPTWDQSAAFFHSRPYQFWYLIKVDHEYVGATYLTKNREIGIFIFSDSLGNGFGEAAVRMLMKRHPGKFLANVNPENSHSRTLWRKLGFELLQLTYIKEPA